MNLKEVVSLTDKHFIDWENDTFGFGYGTGEQYTLKALRDFFSLLEDGTKYGYEILEKELGHLATWLLINTLCHADIIEYGTSPRYGWLTAKGKLLAKYVGEKSEQELYELVTSQTQEYVHCYRNYCNCDEPCNNPLFNK